MEVSALNHAGAAGLHGRSPLLRLQSDERLVALTRRGSHHAFEALVARYESRLLAFCRHMLASKEDAEDVLQEVFAAAFNAMLADERAINVRPWLYRIARNRSLNHLRRAQAVGVDSMDIHLAEGGLTTADKAHRREEFRQLISDVQDLPETQKTALLLREIDALSYDQIAEAMETTVPSVKSLLVRARVSLAEAAEARGLSCAQVRTELGEVAEGLTRTTAPVRRHLRTCERCQYFRKQLRSTNKALAAVFPVGPLLLLKKVILTQLGTTAAAGSGAAAASGGGSAAGVAAGGALQAGMQAVATKAAAGLAAAAIVTAGAVEVKHVAVERDPGVAQVSRGAAAPAPAPAQAQAVAPAEAPSSAPAPSVAAPVALKPLSKPDAPSKSDRKAVEKSKTPAVEPTPKKTLPATTPPVQASPSPQVDAEGLAKAGPVSQIESDTTSLPTTTAATPETNSSVHGPPAPISAPTAEPVVAQPLPATPPPAPSAAPSPEPRSAPDVTSPILPEVGPEAPLPTPRTDPLPLETLHAPGLQATELEPVAVAP